MFADASHFSMVGYPVEMTSEAALIRSVKGMTKGCISSDLDPTDVVCVIKDPSGGELRMGLRRRAPKSSDMEFYTANPAFDGEGRTPVIIDGDISDPEWKTWEPIVAAKFGDGETPLVIELADPTEAPLFKPGAKLTVEIAAFSFEPEIYADSDAFMASQADDKVQFADKFFVPIGMFENDEGRPTPYGMFAAEVIKAELRINTTGGGKFWWLLVRGYEDATFDVVIDPRQITVEPKPGSVVTGVFWMTARIARP